MGADRLWEIALEQQGREDAVQFIRWRWRHGLSSSAAAEALGISRRQLAYYASGKHGCRARCCWHVRVGRQSVRQHKLRI